MPRKHAFTTLLALLVLAVAGAGCGGASDSSSSSGEAAAATGGETLSLVAYSTPQVVYDQLIPAFQKTPRGKGVEFKTSFGASGDQSRAVEGGLKADVVSFSIDPDMQRLVKAGLVEDGYGLVSTSRVAFVVRKGNPKGIRTWDDLLKPGVEVVTPNPFTSGAAKWNLLGAYAFGGIDYVRELITQHVEVQPKSGREALQAFTQGTGDVLLSYEYEGVTAQKKGEDIDVVVPDKTVRIEITIATTKDAPAAARDFVDYVKSAQGQKFFADWGYDPPDDDQGGATTIDQLGGWEKVDADLFDVEGGSIAKIEEDAGVSTAK